MPITLSSHMWPRALRVHLGLLASGFPDFENHVQLFELREFADRQTADSGAPRAAIFDYWQQICRLTAAQRQQQLSEILKQERERAALYREISAVVPEFGGPHCAAEYVYWAKFPLWTAVEAITLALGMDPRKVSWQDVEPHVEHCILAAQFRDCLELVNREQHAGNLEENLAPADFVAWAKGKIDLPGDLVKMVKKHGAGRRLLQEIKTLKDEIAELKERHSARTDIRVLRTLQRVFLGMATGRYGYDPEKPRNSTAPRMSADLYKYGYGVSEDTLRAALATAHEEVPADAGSYGLAQTD